MSLKDAVGRYVDLYHDFYNECLELASTVPDVSGGNYCISEAATKVIQTLFENSNKKSPGCGLNSYVFVVMKHANDSKPSADKIVSLLEDKATSSILGAIEKFKYQTYGCLIGGAAASGVGSLIGLEGGPGGASIGAALSFPLGCRLGTQAGSEIYVLKKGLKKIDATVEIYNRVKAKAFKIWEEADAHYAACNVNTTLTNRLQQTPIFWERATPKSTTIKTYLGEKSKPSTTVYEYDKPHLFIKPTKQIATHKNSSSSTVLVPIPHSQPMQTPALSASPPAPLSILPVEETALKLLAIAGNLSGIAPAIDQANDLRKLFVTVLSDPVKAPELLMTQFYKGPQEIFQNIITTPKQMLTKLAALNADPNLNHAMGVAGGVLSIMSLTIEVLPIIQKISLEASRNPLKLPIVIPKELLRLTFNKILGVVQLGKDFINDPFKAAGNLVNGVLRTPENFCRAVRDFFTGGRKAKRKRRRLEEAIRQQQLQEEKLRKEAMEKISHALGECFETANRQWMKLQDQPISSYFTQLFRDWKRAVEKKILVVDFLQYVNKIQSELEKGNFSDVYWLSPTAHTKELVAPPMVAHAFRELVLSGIKLQVEIVRFEGAIKADEEATKGLATATKGLQKQNQQFVNFLDTNKDALKMTLQGMQEAYLSAKK